MNAGMPVTDECTQDWTIVSEEVGADGLIFEAERALDTGDSQDRVFADDSLEGNSTDTSKIETTQWRQRRLLVFICKSVIN